MEYLAALAYFIYALAVASVGVAVGVAACIAAPCAEYLVAGVRVYARVGGLPDRARPFTRGERDDHAQPLYLYGPARADLRYVQQLARARWRRESDWWRARLSGLLSPRESPAPLTAPLAVGIAIGLVITVPAAALLTAVIWLAHEIIIDLGSSLVAGPALVLRAADSAYLSARHIRMRCVACWERIPYPAYKCPQDQCQQTHWDIRPGRYGVLRRTCECGQRMPTLLLLGAAARLQAKCPHRTCGQPLAHRPGEVPELLLPIFGAKGAGKTLLLVRLITTMRDERRPGIEVAPADEETGNRLADLESMVRRDGVVPATPLDIPRSYVLRLRIGRHRRIVHLVDAAGELFYTSERSRELIYLGDASSFVLVIDPLSVSDFWNGLPPVARQRFAPDRSPAPHPDVVFQQTADRIKEMGRRHARHRLAVVFTRADLLGTEYGPPSPDSSDISQWAAADLGLSGLLLQAKMEFHEISFFYTGAGAAYGTDMKALSRWLMRGDGLDTGLG